MWPGQGYTASYWQIELNHKIEGQSFIAFPLVMNDGCIWLGSERDSRR